MGYYGIEHYFYGPKLHDYLRELNREAFAPYQAFTVGETPGVGMEMSKLLTGESRKELDMVFSFDHLETPGHVRFDDYRYDLNYYKEYITDWMEHYGSDCWMSLFFENHDNPRMISKINPDPAYREVIAKLLALLLLTLKGTPFIFQGQEIGSVNKNFKSIKELKDVESVNLFRELKKSMAADPAFLKVLSGSRDHARTPVQWDSSSNAGFSKGRPWIGNDEDYKKWNVQAQQKDENSVLNFYRKLIDFRKSHKSLIYGEFQILHRKQKDIFTYVRKYGDEIFYMECNLSSRSVRRPGPDGDCDLILSNYPEKAKYLKPYKASLYLIKNKEKVAGK
jgi:oligo-1,6-glucosidase